MRLSGVSGIFDCIASGWSLKGESLSTGKARKKDFFLFSFAYTTEDGGPTTSIGRGIIEGEGGIAEPRILETRRGKRGGARFMAGGVVS